MVEMLWVFVCIQCCIFASMAVEVKQITKMWTLKGSKVELQMEEADDLLARYSIPLVSNQVQYRYLNSWTELGQFIWEVFKYKQKNGTSLLVIVNGNKWNTFSFGMLRSCPKVWATIVVRSLLHVMPSSSLPQVQTTSALNCPNSNVAHYNSLVFTLNFYPCQISGAKIVWPH